MSSQAGKICPVCEPNKFGQHIMICSECRRASQHIYGMHRPQLDTVPVEWYCQPCIGGSSQPIETRRLRGSVRTSEVQGSSSGEGNMGPGASQNKTASDSFQPTGPGSNAEMIDQPGPYIILRDDEPYPPVNDVCWRGDFEVADVTLQIFTGIRAHTPGKLHRKAYDMLKLLPEKLKLREHRRLDIWPKSFDSNPPTLGDIGIYFFAKEYPEYRDRYRNFLKRLDRTDRALRCIQGDIQFLIFTSTQLEVDSLGALKSECKNNIFLWGLFRHIKPKEASIQHEDQPHHLIDTAVIDAAKTLLHLRSAGNWRVQMVDSKIHDEPNSDPEMPPGFEGSIHGNPPPSYPQKRKKLLSGCTSKSCQEACWRISSDHKTRK